MVSTRQSSNMGSGSSSGRVSESVEAIPSTSSSRKQQSHSSSANSPQELAPVSNLTLLNLPPEIIDKILSHFNLNTVSQLRLVCHKFNTVCGARLSTTFQRLQAQMLARFQAIKSQMPRRESARRMHPLACECDVIETLHMRLTLLQMSFGKHIERKHCCFFPGEILDEVYRILHIIKVAPKITKPFTVTDELFDLTTMAMEYFKEKIEPTLPEISYFGPDFLDLAGTFSSSSGVSKLMLDATPLSGDSNKDSGSGGECSPSHRTEDPVLMRNNVSSPQSNMFLRKRIRKIKQGMKRYNSQLSLVRRDLRNCKSKVAEQQKQIVEYASRLDDHDKKNEETSRKFSTLLQELNKCKTELQYWRSKSPAISVCNGCGQSMPMPTEDLQALANQSVLSDSFSDALNFIPIADTDSPTDVQHPHTSSLTSDMAPPKTPLSNLASKRKLLSAETTNDIIKKPKRAVKSRQAKRSKI